MIEIKLRDVKVLFYDSIKTLPNARKLLSDQYALWDNGIGTSLEKVRENLINAKAELLNSDNKTNAAIYIENADIGIEALRYGEDFKLKDLCCFLYSIDGNIIEDLNIENIDSYYGELNNLGITIGQVDDTLDTIKKNSIEI